MFTKLLLTLGVILIVVMVVRGQTQPPKGAAAKPSPPPPSKSKPSTTRITAWTLVGVFVTLTLAYSAWQWLGTREVVSVRVVNANTGTGIRYRAYRGDIGEHGFTTIDGRSISLAEIERLEVTRPRE